MANSHLPVFSGFWPILRLIGGELKNGVDRGHANALVSETGAANGSSGFAAPVKCFEGLLSFFEFLGELFLGRQGQPVFSGKHFITQVPESVMRDRFIPFGAEDEFHRRVLSGVCPMLPGIIEIQVHLAGGVTRSPGRSRCPLRSRAALFRESAVRS